eukprot:82572_1
MQKSQAKDSCVECRVSRTKCVVVVGSKPMLCLRCKKNNLSCKFATHRLMKSNDSDHEELTDEEEEEDEEEEDLEEDVDVQEEDQEHTESEGEEEMIQPNVSMHKNHNRPNDELDLNDNAEHDMPSPSMEDNEHELHDELYYKKHKKDKHNDHDAATTCSDKERKHRRKNHKKKREKGMDKKRDKKRKRMDHDHEENGQMEYHVKRQKRKKIKHNETTLRADSDWNDFKKFDKLIHKWHEKDPGTLPLDSCYLQSMTAFTGGHHFLGTYPWPYPDDWLQ